MIFRAADLQKVTLKMLPFADAASEGLPLRQLLRLSLFQVSVGMAGVMLLDTLNRVMIGGCMQHRMRQRWACHDWSW